MKTRMRRKKALEKNEFTIKKGNEISEVFVMRDPFIVVTLSPEECLLTGDRCFLPAAVTTLH